METKVTVINNKRKRNSTKRTLPKTHPISARLDDAAYENLLEKKEMTGNNTSEIINDLLKNKSDIEDENIICGVDLNE